MTSYAQMLTAVTRDESHGFVVIWESTQQGPLGTHHQIRGQRYDSDGNPKGSEFRVSSEDDRYDFDPASAQFGDGNLVVIWRNEDQIHDTISGRQYDSNGEALGSKFQINTGIHIARKRPAVGPTGNDGFIAVWQGNSHAKGRIFRDDGQTVGNDLFLSQNPIHNRSQPVTASDGGQGFVVAWTANSQYGGETPNRHVFARTFQPDGTPRGDAFRVSQADAFEHKEPAVSPDGSGGFIVVWQSKEPGASNSSAEKVHGKRYTSTGSSVGSQFLVNRYPLGKNVNPSVSLDTTGGFVVVWEGKNASPLDPETWSVQGQRFSAQGQYLGEQFMVNTYTTEGQRDPSISPDGSGGFVVAWRSLGGFGNDDGWSTEARRFFNPGSSTEPFACLEDDETICLQNGRFEVQAFWRDFAGGTGVGRLVPGASTDSALFWFFNESNWEMLVKVLEGCPLNDRYWVFAAATTDVEYTLRVRDSLTGEISSYTNPLGTASPAITDSGAFSTCP